MATIPCTTALIVGAGPGISFALAKQLAALGVKVGLVARNDSNVRALAKAIDATPFVADAADSDAIKGLFADVDTTIGPPDFVLYNASARVRGPLVDLDPDAVRKAIAVSAFGAFLVGQQAAQRMLPRKTGAIFFTGASAGVKGFPQSAAFAMGKFAMRGLTQSMARELGPQGIHVAHFVIDGSVRSSARPDPSDAPDSTLDPDAIAQVCVDTLRQPRSAWSQEVELRPWVERF